MKHYFFLLLLICIATTNGRSQDEQEILIEFGERNYEINDEVKAQVDVAIGRLKGGETVLLTFLDENDLNKEEKHQITIAQRRGMQVLDYINKRKFQACIAEAHVAKKKKRSSSVVMSNADLRAMTKLDGIMSLRVARDVYWQPMFFMDPVANAQKPCQEFRISNKRGGVIYGENGTQVYFPPESFVATGCEDITICLQEYYEVSDMVKAGLTTMSNGKLLVSEGMIYIQAVDACSGSEARLKKEVTIAMPALDGDKDTRYFRGRREDLMIDWQEKEEDSFELMKEGQMVEGTEPQQSEDDESEGEGEGGIYLENSSFVFKTRKLDWINCDRYYEIKEPVDLIVEGDQLNSQTTILVVLKEDRSIIPGYLYADETAAMFQPLPENKPITVIAMRSSGSDYELAVVESNTSDGKVKINAFRSMSEGELSGELSSYLDN